MAKAARVIVMASGCFDLLHPGHLAYLEAAKAYGDELVVSVSSDEVVRAQKGPKRPFFPLAERLAMLGALKVVNKVFISMTDDQVAAINRIRPKFYVKGQDYTEGDVSGRLARELLAVEALGGKLVIVDTWPRYSSTSIMKALA